MHRAVFVVNCVNSTRDSTSKWLDQHMHRTALHPCHVCRSAMCFQDIRFDNDPEFVAFALDAASVHIDHAVEFDGAKRRHKLHLRGVIYLANYHFTSKIISVDGSVWFHDGQTTRAHCTLIGNLNNFTPLQLVSDGDKRAVMAIYCKK